MKNRKLVALLLSGVMAVSTLAGCGSTDTSKDSSATKDSTAGSTAQVSSEQKETATEAEEFDPRSVTEGVKLTIAVPMDANVIDYETNEMTLAIEERLGVDLSFEVYASDTYNDKLNVMINGGDKLPDIILSGNDGSDGAVWGAAGAIIDLSEYFANADYAQSMYTMKEASGYDVVELARTVEGNVWGYPTFGTDLEATVAFNLLINKEYAKAVGFDELPTTTDEFLELARAFKAAGDVNGNGKDDEVVITGYSKYWFKCLMSSFIYAWCKSYLLNDNGELYFAYTTDEWKEGLKWLHTMFQEGLIDSGVLTNDSTAYYAIERDPDCRILADVFYWPVLYADDGSRVFEKMKDYEKPVFLTSPVNDDVKSYYKPATPTVGCFISSDCENPLAAFLVLDLIASEEFTRTNRVGKKGETWDYWCDLPDSYFEGLGVTRDDYEIIQGKNDDGQHFAIEYGGMISSAQNVSWNRKGPILYNDVGVSRAYLTTDPNEYEYWTKRAQANEIADESYLPGDEFVTNANVAMTVEEADECADILTALNSYVEESIGSFLTGLWDIDTYWETYLAELDKIGIDEMLEIYQTVYDRNTK